MQFIRQKLLRLSPVPDDLEEIVRIDARREANPESVGLRQEDLDRVWDEVLRVYRSGVHPAITINLRYRGKVVMARSVGHSRGNGPNDSPESERIVARPETPMCLFSASKAVTALLMHLLAEDGLVDLSRPVAFYNPEFGRKGKERITLHQVLAHRGGIPGLPSDTPIETLWDEDATWELLCDAEPIITDGSKLAYHAITGGFVLERVLRTVTGAGIDDYLERKIRQPMKMRYFTFGARPEHRDAVAFNYATGPRQGPVLNALIRRALGTDMEAIEAISNDARFHDAIIPAGNLVATAAEVSAFFQMMLDGGTWRGRRICRPDTVASATREVGSRTFDRTLLLPMRYSAGLMLGDAPVGLWGPNSREAFGHVGLINKFAWADPKRQLSAAVLTSGILLVAHHLWPFARLVGSISGLAPGRAGRKAVAAA